MSKNTLILGGAGQCARLITPLLVRDGHTVHSVIRNPDQAPALRDLGAHPVVLDLERASTADLAAAIAAARATTVLWCAGASYGSPPDRIRAVDQEAALRAMDAAAEVREGDDVLRRRRYVVISALDVRDRETRPVPPWYDEADRARSDRAWAAMGLFFAAKLVADRSLVTENGRRRLAYTIVRPGGMNTEPGRGTVAAGRPHLGSMVSRADVAAVVVECLRNDSTMGLTFDVVGGEVDVADAVADVGRNRIDSFEGFY